jgi:YD repeat-containing protein
VWVYRPFNYQQNQQNCEYAYDNMGRLTKADCGSAWGQSFSYDAFGNIAKSRLDGATLGTDSKASYDSNTNRLTGTYQVNDYPPVSPTYDDNGNPPATACIRTRGTPTATLLILI